VELAQFILEGDATSLVAAGQIQKRVIREAEQELRRAANESKRFDEAAMARLKEKAKLVVQEKNLLKEIGQAQKNINNAEETYRGRKSDMSTEGVRGARRWRDALNQVAYGMGDIMSVQGGMAEMIRASANNIQYMVAQIPGKIGTFAVIGAVIGQAFGMVAAKMGDSVDLTKEAEKSAKAAHKAYMELLDDVEKVTLKEADYEKEKRRREFAEKAAKAETAAQAARDVYTSYEKQARLEGGGIYLEPLKALAHMFTFGLAPNQFDTATQMKNALADVAARESEAGAARRARDLATAGANDAEIAKKLEKALEKMQPQVEQEYFRIRTKTGSPEEAREQVVAMVSASLSKDESRVAARIVDKMIEEFKMSLSHQRFQDTFAQFAPEGEKMVQLRDLLDAQKRELAEVKGRQLSDGERNKLDEKLIKDAEIKVQQTQALIDAMIENNKLLLENNRRMAIQQGEDEGNRPVPELNPRGNE
jgi:hypothetical protein